MADKLYQYLGYHFEIQTDAGAEKTYIGKLKYFNTGWSFQESNEGSITKEGKYSFIIEGSDLDPYGIFLDINDILGDHPNADLAITEIKVDGNDIPFDDTIIDRGTGDDANTASRYILNQWAEVLFAEKAFAFESSIKISIMLSFNDDMELAE